MTVSRVAEIARDVRSFRLVPTSGEDLETFSPGAHIEITLPWQNGSSLVRHYSLTSDPADLSYYEIAVLKERQVEELPSICTGPLSLAPA